MKIILTILFGLIAIGVTSYSYGQYTVVDSDTVLPEVMLQLELRNASGGLVTYIEATQIIAIYPNELNSFLDKINYKEFLIKDGKAFEKIQWQGRTEKFEKQHAFSQFNLWDTSFDEPLALLTVRHHSYQTQPDDTITVYWTIIRPAN